MSKAKTAATQQDGSGNRVYYYSSEIAQMLFVFGEVQEPNPETVSLVEDIVRSQVVEIVIQARQQAARRGSKTLTVEDLIFLIRSNRDKVNRLRTYLSWKDVRKNAKDSAGGDAGAAGDVDLEEGGAEKLTAKAQKMTVKLPWEIPTIYSEILKQSGHRSDDEEDEDELEAHEDSIQRLREADEATRRMTREEYLHYSESRQASFTFRKAKRFRDFMNLPPHLDIRPNDDTIDILGFLAFEMVRALCLRGLEVKKSLEEASSTSGTGETSKRRLSDADLSPSKRFKGDVVSLLGSPPQSSLFLPPPEARSALRPEHVQEGFARMQRKSHTKSAGLTNWKGGLVRSTITLI